MTGHRRIHGNVRCFAITDFSHKNNIRILAYKTAQSGSKRQIDGRIDLNMIHSLQLVLHRIFDRGDIHVRSVAHLHERGERGGFSRTRRPRRQNHAKRLLYCSNKNILMLLRKSKVSKRQSAYVGCEKTHDDLFSIDDGNDGDTHIVDGEKIVMRLLTSYVRALTL